jgi:hypothetical protein
MLPYTPGIVPCEERERLTRVDRDALRRTAKADRAFTQTKGEAWWEVTRMMQEDCEAALAALDAHQKGHGC